MILTTETAIKSLNCSALKCIHGSNVQLRVLKTGRIWSIAKACEIKSTFVSICKQLLETKKALKKIKTEQNYFHVYS